ncbi:DUF6296 family protein [Kitasatospora sp. NPDC051914]|uniref:DUF6296 family protein n=1 Tax=Kitasatospora sp. NPDC051914 TaxID=3154945 RepID=UPI003418A85D
MALVHRYLVVFPGRVGGHAPQPSVVVTATGRTGPGGHPVYTDETGRVRVEITEHGTARLLTPTPLHRGPLHAEPLS